MDLAVMGKQLPERYLIRKRHREKRPQAAAKVHLLTKGQKLEQLHCLPLPHPIYFGELIIKGVLLK